VRKTAHCPFHDDEHKSFSVFQGKDGKGWQWKCFAGCGEGDEIAFLRRWKGLSMSAAISLYLEIAGFPPLRPLKSHECRESLRSPEFRKSPKYHESPVYPMSNGQGPEKVLKSLAARNACKEPNTARKRRFKLVRDLRAIEKGIGRELEIAELMVAFNE